MFLDVPSVPFSMLNLMGCGQRSLCHVLLWWAIGCECARVVRKTQRGEVGCVHRYPYARIPRMYRLKTMASAYTSDFLFYSFIAAEGFSFITLINVSISKSRSCYGGQFKSFNNLYKSMSSVFSHMSAASIFHMLHITAGSLWRRWPSIGDTSGVCVCVTISYA